MSFSGTSSMRRSGGLPGPAGLWLAVVAILAVAALVLGWRINPAITAIVAGGGAGVMVLLLIYRRLLVVLKQSRSGPLTRGILSNSAAAPRGISEPALHARLDDLRRTFQIGVEKFHAAGKNLYSLPWYLLVGEAGAGKTEAIRRCGVGFPPGLHDPLQGVGGTINMHWWFTNDAVILDIAGRMFEGIQAGSGEEWEQFLKLLAQSRPKCPINGLLLVIPADRLIPTSSAAREQRLRDGSGSGSGSRGSVTAKASDSRAARCEAEDPAKHPADIIARQLEVIQRTLGVRFPVFVLITKSDWIVGFREFFDRLDDPQAQHQMLGWSAPANLDTKIVPDQVEEHLKSVAQRLRRRRLGLMLDPVHTEDSVNGRRIDEVDSLYAFSESLMELAPRLRTYLEKMFVAGEWAPKPLFLRGIYFTSSMNEGAALDAQLAEALKVPINKLPESKAWKRDRPRFLGDLFKKKVFRERGLVTGVSQTARLQSGRRRLIYGAGCISSIVLLALTVWGAVTFRDRIEKPKREWRQLSQTIAQYAGVIARRDDGTWKYEKNLADALAPVCDQKPIEIPWIFPARAFGLNDVNGEREKVFDGLYGKVVLQPLLVAARQKLARDSQNPDQWGDQSTDVLRQLIRLEVLATGLTTVNRGGSCFQLEPLFRYVVGGVSDPALQRGLDHLHALHGSPWLKGFTGNEQLGNEPGSVVIQGVNGFYKHWTKQVATLAVAAELGEALKQFEDAESSLVAPTQGSGAIVTLADYQGLAASWKQSFGALSQAKERVDQALPAARKWAGKQRPSDRYNQEIQRIGDAAGAARASLLDQLPLESPTPGAAGWVGSLRNRLTDRLEDHIRESSTKKSLVPAISGLPRLEDRYLAAESPEPYDDIFKSFEQVNNWLVDPSARSATGAATQPTEMQPRPKLAVGLNAATARAATTMLDQAARYRKYLDARRKLDAGVASVAAVRKLVLGEAEPLERLPRPVIRYTVDFSQEKQFFDGRYHPQAAVAVLEARKRLRGLIEDKETIIDRPTLLQDFQQGQNPYDDYTKEYAEYWDGISHGLAIRKDLTWKQLLDGAASATPEDVRNELIRLARLQVKALEDVRPLLPPEDEKAIARKLSELKKDQELVESAWDKIKLVADNWQRLVKQPGQARQEILGQTVRKLCSDYLVPEKEDAADLYFYWRDSTIRQLEIVAREGTAAVRGKLRALARFPLAPPTPGVAPLTAEEFYEARKLLEGRLPVDNQPERTISDSDRTKDPKVDIQLDLMQGLDLPDQEKKWIENLRGLLVALPSADKPGGCVISSLGTRSYAEQKYSQALLKQKGVEVGLNSIDGSAVELGALICPGGAIELVLSGAGGTHPFTADKNKLEPYGVWGCIGLLFVYQGKCEKDDKVWDINIPVEPANSLSVGLRLKFTRGGLPALDKWPVPPRPEQPVSKP